MTAEGTPRRDTPSPPHLRSVTLRIERYPTDTHYPFNLPVLRRTRRIEFTRPLTFFVGENGAGKSTLLEAVARRCGIHIWEHPGVRRFDVNPHAQKLQHFLSIEWADGKVPGSFFSSQNFRHFCELLDTLATGDPGQLRYFGGRSLVSRSHGESLMAYFRARYEIEGLYFMDEPETALSPRTQLDLVRLLARASRAGHAQFLIATHSPILLACPGATILNFDAAPLAAVPYERTDHYRLYKRFMDDPAAHVHE